MSDGAIIAKTRAVYGTLLKREDYFNLIHRSSVGAAVSYLKGTPRYKEVFADADAASLHRGQVEFSLGKTVFDTYQRICRFFVTGSGIKDFYLRSEEAEQLSKAVVAVSSGTQERFYLSMPHYLLDLMSFQVEAAARASNAAELLAAISGTIYAKPLQPYLSAAEPDVNKCLSVIHNCYLSWAFMQIHSDFKGKKREELEMFFLRKAECDSVLRCYRLKRFFDLSNEQVNDLILKYRLRVKPREMEEALNSQNPSEALLELLSRRCLPKNSQVDRDFPELVIERANYDFFRRKLLFTKDAMEALYSLIVLLETERMNLQRIIEGIRYSLPPQDIEKYVIL